MNLNIEAAEEMDRDPCIFMEERYDEDSDEYQKSCSLTTTKVSENHPSYVKECDPTMCPIWRTYIIQVMIAKKLSIQI